MHLDEVADTVVELVHGAVEPLAQSARHRPAGKMAEDFERGDLDRHDGGRLERLDEAAESPTAMQLPTQALRERPTRMGMILGSTLSGSTPR
jgi:hypothetical protein